MASGLQKATFPNDSLPKSIPLEIGNAIVSVSNPTVVTLNNHTLNTGDMFYFAISGIVPTGLSVDIKYYVADVTTNTFKIATSYDQSISSSGTRVGVSSITGVGTITILCSVFYVRYRIISKDKNRYSHWSPFYHIIDPDPTILLPSIGIDGGIV